jgi:hypothetical protein
MWVMNKAVVNRPTVARLTPYALEISEATAPMLVNTQPAANPITHAAVRARRLSLGLS